jgi:ferric-dicitrate binding protein FerR (iron transport regulator)
VKNERSLTDLAARALATDARRERPVSESSRSAAIAGMAQALRMREKRRRLKRAAFGMSAVAAAIALAVTLGRAAHEHGRGATAENAPKATPAASALFVRGAPVVVRHGAPSTLSNGAALETGDRLVVAPGSRTTVALPNGTSLALADSAELVFTSPAPTMSFELTSGTVHADVAKLLPSERFVIRTADAEVEVHGTSFDVLRVAPDPGCGEGNATRVKVREGVVTVRAGGREVFVRAKEEWPSGCATAPSTSAASSTSSAPQPEESEIRTAVKRSAEPPLSTLGTENDLYERALKRKRSGDAPGAVAAFEALLTRFPSGHLAQTAAGERMKLLRDVDKTRAKRAAREYLQRYPNGFARADAELILATE